MAKKLDSRLTKNLLPAILDTVEALIVVLDRGGRIVLFNGACERATGFSAGEVLDRHVWDALVPAEEADAVRAVFDELTAGMFPNAHENDWLCEDGSRRRVAWSNTALLGRDGEVAYVVGTGIDVTERRSAESRARELAAEQAARALAEAEREARRISEAKFAGIVAIASDAIVSIDHEQRIILFNSGAERVFGYEADEVMGRDLARLIPERFRAGHREHIARFAAAPEAARQMGERRQIFGLRKDGREFPAEASISKLDVNGRRIFTVMLRDVTERRRAEQARKFLDDAGKVLSESLDYEETLASVARLAVRSLADFCFVDIVDEDGGVRRLAVAHADPALEAVADEIHRYPLDRDRPHLVFRALKTREPELLESVSDVYLAALAQGPDHLRALRALEITSYLAVPMLHGADLLGAITFVGSRGRTFDADDLALAAELARRAALAVENARLYRKAQLAIQARDDILAIVSHDLGNSLAAVFIGANMLARAGQDGGSGVDVQAVEAIRKSSEQMERLIHDLLEVRRIEAGRLQLEPTAVPVGPLIDQALQMLSPLASVKEHRLVARVPQDLPPVLADGDRVLQVLSNLVGNAVKFSPRGGTVVVRAEIAGDEVRVCVADDGPGIPEDHLPHIFDRFWQATRSGRRGLGLGLAIVKGIVEAHGGRVAVDSSPGAGSEFRFTLPVAPSS